MPACTGWLASANTAVYTLAAMFNLAETSGLSLAQPMPHLLPPSCLRRRPPRRLRRFPSHPIDHSAFPTPAEQPSPAPTHEAGLPGFGVADACSDSGGVASRPGLPCRARYAVSSLRAGIPRPSVRFAHCAVPLPGGSLRSPPFAWSPSAHVTSTLRFFHHRNLLALALHSMSNSDFAALPVAALVRDGSPRSLPRRLYYSVRFLAFSTESHFQ